LEPQKKVLVAVDFLDGDHGEIACEICHGGNAEAPDKTAAHEGLKPNPPSSFRKAPAVNVMSRLPPRPKIRCTRPWGLLQLS
jgi:hypothetical protein